MQNQKERWFLCFYFLNSVYSERPFTLIMNINKMGYWKNIKTWNLNLNLTLDGILGVSWLLSFMAFFSISVFFFFHLPGRPFVVFVFERVNYIANQTAPKLWLWIWEAERENNVTRGVTHKGHVDRIRVVSRGRGGWWKLKVKKWWYHLVWV